MTVNKVQLAAAVGGIVLLLASFGAGRYSAPSRVETRVVTKTEVQVVEKAVVHEVQGPVRTVTKTVERLVPCASGPAEPVRETTTVVEAAPVVIDTVKDTDEHMSLKTSAVSVTTREQPRLMLQAGAIVGTSLKPAYRLGVLYRAAGPLWVGGSYLSTHAGELTLAITF